MDFCSFHPGYECVQYIVSQGYAPVIRTIFFAESFNFHGGRLAPANK
jgi:hypothetical protein